MNSTAAAAGMAAGMGFRPLFTASQYEELAHQALIYKYLVQGVPVPAELLLPIRRSLESMASRFYHHPTLGYYSYFGKKPDPEPGRCRRTDGKKWRCSKEAYPDSKYCERHMHRGRNRSRKPVETQPQPLTLSQSPSASTVTSIAATGSNMGGSGSFQSIPLHSVAGGSSAPGSFAGGASSSQLQLYPGSYGTESKDYRYPYEAKAEVGEHSFFSEASGSVRGLGMDSSVDSSWRLMPSPMPSFSLSKGGNDSVMQGNYSQVPSLHDLGQATMSSLTKQEQPQQFFGNEYGLAEPVKHENQSLRPFFDEWPKARDSWSDLEDERSNRTSFSTTQLSISIPMASSDFSTTSSRSPNDD